MQQTQSPNPRIVAEATPVRRPRRPLGFALAGVLSLCAAAADLAPAQSTTGPAATAPPNVSAALVLGGTRLAVARIETAARPLLEPSMVAIVPVPPTLGDPRVGSFQTPGKDTAALETALEGAYAVEVRRSVRAARAAGKSIDRVVSLYDGLDMALALIAEGQLRPRRLIVVDPTAAGLTERFGAATWPDEAPRLEVDVFFSCGERRRMATLGEAVRRSLVASKLSARVFTADLRGASLEAVLEAAQWPIRGARFARVTPDRLLEVNAERVLEAVDGYDVVFAGEQHDNLVFQSFELALLKRMDRGDGSLALSLEMFERDVQPILDRYLAGEIVEDAFLDQARPWPNYAKSYRPLVEYARAHGIPVIAANVPRRLARSVAREGFETLMLLSDDDQEYASEATHARTPGYRKRFKKVMKHLKGESLDRMFHAQCLKDDTMAESIDRLLEARPEIKRVLHVNGSFHSSFGLGTARALETRREAMRVGIITCQSTENPAAVDLATSDRQDHFLVFAAEPPRRDRSSSRKPKKAPAPKKPTDSEDEKPATHPPMKATEALQ